MALADVLSAMREIILDAPKLPSESSERERLYIKKFPTLTAEEREDLARIDPAKFSIYTTSIFQSEKDILENHMPITFALVKQHWAEAYNQKFIGWHLTRELHQRYPWNSQAPQTLVDNFAHWVSDNCPELRAIRPDLAALAELERHSYQLKRAPDSVSQPPKKPLTPETLADTTVEALLEAPCTFREPRALIQLPFNAPLVRSAYFDNGSTVTDLIAPEIKTTLLGTRARNNAIIWLEIPESLFHALRTSPETLTTVGALAEVLLSDQDTTDERAALEYLLKHLSLLMSHQVIEIELMQPMRG